MIFFSSLKTLLLHDFVSFDKQEYSIYAENSTLTLSPPLFLPLKYPRLHWMAYHIHFLTDDEAE